MLCRAVPATAPVGCSPGVSWLAGAWHETQPKLGQLCLARASQRGAAQGLVAVPPGILGSGWSRHEVTGDVGAAGHPSLVAHKAHHARYQPLVNAPRAVAGAGYWWV